MICVSLMEPTVELAVEAARGLDMVEFRLDGFRGGDIDMERLFALPARTMATLRAKKHSDAERSRMLISAMEAGADLVDVELDSDPGFRRTVVEAARDLDRTVVVSHHEHQKTPSLGELKRLEDRCFEAGGEIAKIAAFCRSGKDAAALLGLLAKGENTVPIGMGERGIITRIAGPLLGAPFTYASLSPGKETAPGQVDLLTLERLIGEVGNG